MGLIIDDGLGSGVSAGVSSDKRLEVSAKSNPRMYYISEDKADVYSWTAVTADLAAGATALYVVNDSPTKLLHIHSVYIYCDVATEYHVHCPAYVAPAGTAVVGTNWNRTSGNLAEATAKANETSNVVTTDVFSSYMEFSDAIILGYHNSIAIDIVADSAAFNCTIVGFFENKE
jgi:hypothetical protein